MRIDLLAQNLAWKSYNEAMQETLRFEGVTWVEWVSDYTQDPARGPCLYCDSQSGRRYHLGQFLPSLPHHPNCKCDWAPILPTEEEYVRKGIFP